MRQAAKSPYKACIYLLYGQFTAHFHPGDDNIYELPMVSPDLLCVRLHKKVPAHSLRALKGAEPPGLNDTQTLDVSASAMISHFPGNLLACRGANEVLCAAWTQRVTLISPLIWVVNRFSIFCPFCEPPDSKLY